MHFLFKISLSFLLFFSHLLYSNEFEEFHLYPEYIYGKNRGPKLGYTEPPIYDPLNDPLFRSGYKDFTPVGVANELKELAAIERIEKMKRIIACADAWYWPFSRTSRDNEPPGIEIELLEKIAKKKNYEISIGWVNMLTRFGPGAPGAAYDRSINKGRCDIVLGLAISGDDHHMSRNQLSFTKPFMSTGFVLVTQGPLKNVNSIDEIKNTKHKIGVPAYSPMSEYAEKNGIPYETFFQNIRVIRALVDQEIQSAMLWSGAVSQAKLDFANAEFDVVKNFKPFEGTRWDMAWIVKTEEKGLLEFINSSFDEMLESGEIQQIVERYGVPFFPPLNRN